VGVFKGTQQNGQFTANGTTTETTAMARRIVTQAETLLGRQ